MSTPVVYQYQKALDAFRREGQEGPLLKRMSELISLLDLTTTLGSKLSGETSEAGAAGRATRSSLDSVASRDEILAAALLIVMGELQVSRAALYVREPDGSYLPRAIRGVKAVSAMRPPEPLPSTPVRRSEAGFYEPEGGPAFEVLSPVSWGDKTVALFLLGPRAGGGVYGDEDMSFLRSVAACTGSPIENGLVYAELREVNQKLSRKIFELKNLFDLSRELTSSFDPDAIRSLFVATVMGHLVVSRAALYLGGAFGLRCGHERGIRGEGGTEAFAEGDARAALSALAEPRKVADLPPGPVRDRLVRSRLSSVFPVSLGDRLEGFVAVGERPGRAAFTDDEHDFVRTLGRQALAALDSVRLHRVEVQKERQDRELQIAREIQRSLFPSVCPELRGLSLAAASEACYEVGGDHYDFILLEDGRLAVAVADVSGKGTPASLLMASVHASLRALAGASTPGRLMARLNQFLLESTQENRFVTLFYAELDPVSLVLRYVSGGHVPPYLLRADQRLERLEEGGPVLGLLEHATYAEGEARLEPGDALAIVTDGATEALSPAGEELGDAGVCRALRTASRGSATSLLEALLAGVHAWTGPSGCSDDLTALILKVEES